MIERRCWKPFLVLIFAFILTLITAKCCLKDPYQQKKVKTTSPAVAVISPIKNKPRQVIRITARDCWIKNFDYQDQRMLSSSDQSDIRIEAKGGDFNSSRGILVERYYLGDAEMVFGLRRSVGFKGQIDITNIKGPTTDHYLCSIKFDKSGVAVIVIMMSKSRITTICQESPKFKTFFQYSGTI